MTEVVTVQSEEFLESIYRLQQREGVARTSELAKLLKVVPGTVTNTVERLEKKGLVVHEAYRGVKLTDEGRNIALKVLRRHRLSERLLADMLHMDWNQVHEAACRLEHGVTDEVAKNIEKALGWPRTCPHGNPIPTKSGGIVKEKTELLSALRPEDGGVVTGIADEKQDTLERAARLGLRPGVHVKVLEKAPDETTVTVSIGGISRALSLKMASLVVVKKSGERLRADSELERQTAPKED